MAAPRPVRGLRASTRLRDAAPVFLAARRADVERHRRALARRMTPGAVHDLRVALRRLRGAVRLFGKGAAMARADAELGRLQDVLGDLRDQDVQRARLSRIARRFPPEQARVLIQVRETMGKARPTLLAAARAGLERWRRRGPRLLEALEGLRPRGRLGGHRMRNRLVHQLETLEELVGAALAQMTPLTMHRLRIAVRRFRYALEFLQPALPAEAEEIRAELVPLQTALGDLHDLDVQMVRVDRHAPPSSLPATADLLQRLQADRARQAAALAEALLRWEEEATALRAQVLLGSSPLRIAQRMR